MAYYKAINKASSISDATAWVDLENITLHKRSQTQKATSCVIPFK